MRVLAVGKKKLPRLYLKKMAELENAPVREKELHKMAGKIFYCCHT
jgi:hypothetical protein